VSQIFEYTFHPTPWKQSASPPVLSNRSSSLIALPFFPLRLLSVLENCYFPVRHKLFTKDNFLSKRMAENLFLGEAKMSKR
jgi:hypothetical protein